MINNDNNDNNKLQEYHLDLWLNRLTNKLIQFNFYIDNDLFSHKIH